jgi:hypothetical protein
VTLAVALVRPEEKMVGVVQRPLQRAECLRVAIDALYLERGFCSGPVICYLKEIKQRAVMAIPIPASSGKPSTTEVSLFRCGCRKSTGSSVRYWLIVATDRIEVVAAGSTSVSKPTFAIAGPTVYEHRTTWR